MPIQISFKCSDGEHCVLGTRFSALILTQIHSLFLSLLSLGLSGPLFRQYASIHHVMESRQELFMDFPPPTVPDSQDSDSASTSSRIRLGKRAISHPPAVSERSSMISSSNDPQEKVQENQPSGILLGVVTLALCCAVFMVTLVCLPRSRQS